MLMRLTRVRAPSCRASPAAGKAADTLAFSPALKTTVACRLAPMQTPPEHTSRAAAGFRSSQVAALKGCSQRRGGGELMSVVQTFPSKHGGRLVDVVELELVEVLELVEELLLEVELLELVEELLLEVELLELVEALLLEVELLELVEEL